MMKPTSDSSLEQQKLALEERKLESENQLREKELEVKASESGWFARLAPPLTTTIGAGVLALFASIAGTIFQGRQTLELEREKFGFSKMLDTQKQQHELILKMISVGDVQQARTNLEFLAQTGLISDRALAERLLKATATPVLPVPSGSSPDRTTQCDNSAINGLIQIDEVALYTESCALQAPGGAHDFYRYIYWLENRGSNAITNIRWEAAQISVQSLPPGQTIYSNNFKNPPRVSRIRK